MSAGTGVENGTEKGTGEEIERGPGIDTIVGTKGVRMM